MKTFFGNNVPLYMEATDTNNKVQLKNTQMGSPFSMRSGYQYNLHQFKSPPFDFDTLDNLENNDPQILISLSSTSSSSGDNFSTPVAQRRMRYRRGSERSPISVVESFGNSTSSANKSPSVLANAPMTMEDDVLVMDGILVVHAPGGRSRYGKDSCGSSSSSVKSDKMDVLCLKEETGICLFGSSSHHLHGMKDMSLTGISNKSKPKLETSLGRSPLTNSPLSSLRSHNSSPTMSRGVAYERSAQGSATSGSPADKSGSRGSRGSTTSRDNRSQVTHSDWAPQDDGIYAWPPGSHNPSRDQVSKYINSYLYAPPVKNRLPVFTSICSDVPSGNISSSPTDKLHFELKR